MHWIAAHHGRVPRADAGARVQCSNQLIWLDLRPTRRFMKYNTRSAMDSAAVLEIVSDFRERLWDSPSRGQCKVAGRDGLRGASDIPKELDGSWTFAECIR